MHFYVVDVALLQQLTEVAYVEADMPLHCGGCRSKSSAY